MKYDTDRELVKRLKRGEDRACQEFFDGYFPRVYRFVVRRVDGDLDAAEDIVQVTLVTALRRIETWRGEASLFTWMCQICRRELGRRYERMAREGQRMVTTGDDDFLRELLERVEAPADDEPEAAYAAARLAHVVHVTLDCLPGRYGEVLELKYVEGLSVSEIAGRLALGQIAVQSMLARARRAFASAFEGLRDEYDVDALLGNGGRADG